MCRPKTQELDDVRRAKSPAERKAESRARERFRLLLKIHEQTDYREGRRRIQRAILACIDDCDDRTLAEEHLLHRRSLDELCTPDQCGNPVRHRFLGLAERIFPVVDPERTRALDLLPAKHRAAIRTAFFPPHPIEDVAKSLGCSLCDAYIKLRDAINDLRILHGACEKSQSTTGKRYLEQDARAQSSPAKDLIVRVLILRQSLDDVAVPTELGREKARELLVQALKESERKKQTNKRVEEHYPAQT
jgi:hypothetical protein